MKILRVRRGFTTNSSAYTEWLPPPGGASANGGQGAAGTTASAGADPAMSPPAGATPGIVVPAPTTSPAQVFQPPSHAGGNAMAIVGIAGALATVFVAERVIRQALRRRRKDDEGSDDEQAG
jgi:hypothetical protein